MERLAAAFRKRKAIAEGAVAAHNKEIALPNVTKYRREIGSFLKEIPTNLVSKRVQRKVFDIAVLISKGEKT